MEHDVPAVGYFYFADVARVGLRHHLDEVGTVDYGIQFRAVGLYVIAHVSKLKNYVGVGFGVDVAAVIACGCVEKVERTLVAAHVALVQQVEACYRAGLRRSGNLRPGGRHKHLVVTPARGQKHCGEDEEKMFLFHYYTHYISNLTITL